MDVYAAALFLHFVGLGLLTAGMTTEWLGLRGLQRSESMAEARTWLRMMPVLRALFLPAVILLLATGGYMVVIRGGWTTWSVAGVLIVVAFAAVGNLHAAPHLAALARAAAEERDPISHEFRSRLAAPAPWVSLNVRAAMVAGLAFLMTTKPGLTGTVLVLCVTGLLGWVAATRPAKRVAPAAQPDLEA